MTKFLKVKKSKSFEFSDLDQSVEFKEFFDIVFEERNKLYLVFNNYNPKLSENELSNIKDNVKDFYINQKGWGKVIFLMR